MITEYQKAYWKSPRGKEIAQKYYFSHKEQKMEYQRLWRENNRDKYRAWAREDAKTEKGKLRDKAQHHNRRLRSKGLLVKTIQLVYEENIKKYGTLTCELCFKSVCFGQDHLEHFIPLSRGGNNERENLGVAHAYCNRQKGNKTLEEYKLWL